MSNKLNEFIAGIERAAPRRERALETSPTETIEWIVRGYVGLKKWRYGTKLSDPHLIAAGKALVDEATAYQVPPWMAKQWFEALQQCGSKTMQGKVAFNRCTVDVNGMVDMPGHGPMHIDSLYALDTITTNV